jgi:septal ring factor EnvC (AmiA/AmiB activator)
MIVFEAERLKDVAALKAKIKALEAEKTEACKSLQQKCSQLNTENATLRESQTSLQNILQSKESELKNHQGSSLLSLILG